MRAQTLARILAKAAREGVDVGDLLASACRTAAAAVGGAERLVGGRPGSWEDEPQFH